MRSCSTVLLIVFLAACTPRPPEEGGAGDESPATAQEAPTPAAPAPVAAVPPPEPAPPPDEVPRPPPTLTQEEGERLALEQARAAPPPASPPAPAAPLPETPVQGPASQAPSQSFLRGREFLLQARPTAESPGPRDYRIGELTTGQPTRLDDPKVIQLFTGFLARLARGEVPQALIAPTWREAVTRPLREAIGQGWPAPAEWRLGQLFWEGDRLVRAPFILRRDGKWAAGLLYAEPLREDWLVADVVVDLMDLRKDRQPAPFEPDAYPILSPLP